MNKRILYPVGLALLLQSSIASAAMVTETWSANVASETDGFTVGEQLSWTVTYDDTSLAWNRYSDADGSVVNTTTRAPFDGNSGYHYASDASYDFGNILDRLLGDDTVIDKFADTHYSYAEFLTDAQGNDRYEQHYQGEDGAIFNMTFSDLQTGSAGFLVFNLETGPRSVTLLASASPVPLPAAAWLFGSGLLGLLGANLRRRQA